MKKQFSRGLTLFFLLWTTVAFAQKYNITGVVADDASKPVEGATVLLLNVSDSSLVAFGRTNAQGSFTLRNIANTAPYLLKITRVGSEPYLQDIPKGVAEPVLTLSGILLLTQDKLLNEAVVSAYKDPVKIKGDTVEFNASSFRTQPNAAAEDLIKKLPGVEVERDGTVKAQGENVTQVLVNGKKFFGKDPKMAMQNLPASAIDKVQVYDKKSDVAEFSGVDDGEREKTINITLKENYNKGTFGNATAGGGVDKQNLARYYGKVAINKFAPGQQLSVVGLANNINKTGFTVEDYVGFTGANQRGGGGGRVNFNSNSSIPIDEGNAKGFRTAYSGGLNFNKQFSPQSELNISYFYNQQINDNQSVTNRENFLPTGSFRSFNSNISRTDNQNHRVNLTYDQKIDTFTTLKLTTAVSYTQNATASQTENAAYRANNAPQNTGETVSETAGSGLNINSSLLLRRRFVKKGRNLAATVSYNRNQSVRNTVLNALTTLYDGAGVGRDSTIKQNDDRDNQRNNYGLNLSYTEPIAKRMYLEFNYNLSNTRNEADRNVYNLIKGEVDNNLSNRYNNDYVYHRGGVTYRWNTKEWNLSTGLQYQESMLAGEFISRGTTLGPVRFRNFLPNFRFDYNPVQGRNVRFYYETSMREPSIDQLQPLVDNSDPLNIYQGNPNLRPEFSNRFTLGFNRFNQANFSMIFGNIRMNYTTDKITNQQSFDNNFRRITQPINVKNDIDGNAFLGFGRPIYKQMLRLNMNVNMTYGQGRSLINGIENITQRYGARTGVRLSLNVKDSFDLNFGANIGYNQTDYSIQTSQNQSFYTHAYDAELNYRLPHHFKLNSSADYTFYQGETFGNSAAVFIWNASVSRFLLKNNRGELKFEVHDILNRNNGIERTADVNYIQEKITRSLGRYYLLTFTYALNPMMNQQGMRPPGGMRIFMRD